MNDPPSHTDAELLKRLSANDDAAFTELYNRYWQKIFVVAANRAGDTEIAKELVQNVFVNLWKRRERLNIKFTFATYIAAAIKCEVINFLARKNREQRWLQHASKLKLVEDVTTNQVDFDELQERIVKLVNQLPEKCKLVFKLSREGGLSQKQIADHLQISEKTVEAHISIAIRKLRTGLGEVFSIFF